MLEQQLCSDKITGNIKFNPNLIYFLYLINAPMI